MFQTQNFTSFLLKFRFNLLVKIFLLLNAAFVIAMQNLMSSVRLITIPI